MKKSPLDGWLSLAVSPFFLTYLGIRSIHEWSIEVGKASEELFRGDRLPVLRIPETAGEDGDGSEN